MPIDRRPGARAQRIEPGNSPGAGARFARGRPRQQEGEVAMSGVHGVVERAQARGIRQVEPRVGVEQHAGSGDSTMTRRLGQRSGTVGRDGIRRNPGVQQSAHDRRRVAPHRFDQQRGSIRGRRGRHTPRASNQRSERHHEWQGKAPVNHESQQENDQQDEQAHHPVTTVIEYGGRVTASGARRVRCAGGRSRTGWP